ncbi:MAG: phosphoribosylamine--glycine ligase [Xylanivirga thermophila]|jgi:phosphoribosylamine---glycine ligase|uniref:phosphoribosylamine--glycine ligase n=1 Tax=Xylanivirga thermophila TaxID=2496273 RepID=UPI00101CD917|nr:phosphoribosylamine--glycine ligase [Xylanivirga thermophila]
MKVLVVGGGGREHALIWKLKQSSKVSKIYCAPGNGGIGDMADCIPIQATDVEHMVEFARENAVDLTIVTPDDPLALGMVDALNNAGLRAFGPTRDAAILEWSKAYAKDFMKKYNIPTAKYEVFNDYNEAIKYLDKISYPVVIKADGLALGKGVVIAGSKQEAVEALDDCMLKKVFGNSGSRVIIEEFLSGREVSILTFTDGMTVVPMLSSQDHKKAFDNDMGPNTGGMGAFAPSPYYTEEVAKYTYENIIKPTIEGMLKEGRRFKGILYFGLMLTDNGPKLLEYNARFGDPETQAVLPLLKTEIIDIFDAIIDERLDEMDISWDNRSAACVVIASGGYPKTYQKGYEIEGLDEIKKHGDLFIFHAGTKKKEDKYYTNGGRVLGITCIGQDVISAAEKVYDNITKVNFKDMFYRTDIGRA